MLDGMARLLWWFSAGFDVGIFERLVPHASLYDEAEAMRAAEEAQRKHELELMNESG